jgi:NADH dehydrogenase FAD-containing subunit
MMKCPVIGATTNSVKLYDGTIIPCYTLIWSGGMTPLNYPANMTKDRIIANKYLEMSGFKEVM